jgi:hypothetical protein
MLQGLHAAHPNHHTISDDLVNMYNRTCRSAAFRALHAYLPHLVAVVALFYGCPAAVRLVREEGPLVVDGRTVESCMGGQQGCPLASLLSCLPYHIALCELQRRPSCRDINLVCYADDTYLNGDPTLLYRAYEEKKATSTEQCGLTSNQSKVVAFSPGGDMSLTPPGMAGSEAEGPRQWLKCVGTFLGDAEACAGQLRSKLRARLANLDQVDRLDDHEGTKRLTDTLRDLIAKSCAANIPQYWARTMPASHTAAATRGGNPTPPMQMADDRVARSWVAVVLGDASPEDRREAAVRQARLPVRLGGHGLCDYAATAPGIRAASVLACWPALAKLSPTLTGVTSDTPGFAFLAEAKHDYEALRGDRDRIEAAYAGIAADVHYAARGGQTPGFHPLHLPPASALPPWDTAMAPPTGDEAPPPPKQRTITAVVHHGKWLEHLAWCRQHDAEQPYPKTDRREASRFISVSQPVAGDWTRIIPTDDTWGCASDVHRTACQRRYGLYIPSLVATDDPLGDALCDPAGDDHADGKPGRRRPGEMTTRHDRTVDAIHAMYAATDEQTVHKPDKDMQGHGHDHEYREFNEHRCPDIVRIQGAQSGANSLCEVRTKTPLVSKWNHGKHRKSTTNPTRHCGDTHGFGNTEDAERLAILGVKERQEHQQHPFDHTTGHGHVPASKEGTTQYRDALYSKGSEVIPWVVETTGAVCPHGVDEIRRCSRRAATRDLTKYTDSWSARSFASHHRQRISSAVVFADARRILKRAAAITAHTLTPPRSGAQEHAGRYHHRGLPPPAAQTGPDGAPLTPATAPTGPTPNGGAPGAPTPPTATHDLEAPQGDTHAAHTHPPSGAAPHVARACHPTVSATR